MSFYSDQQRKFFFAVIAPMRAWGGEVLTDMVVDPIASALGWKKEERAETVKRIEKAVNKSHSIALLSEDEIGQMKERTLSEAAKEKLINVLTETLETSGLEEHVSEYASLFLDKKELAKLSKEVAPRFSTRKPGTEEGSNKKSDYTGDGAYNYPRAAGRHKGADVNGVPKGTACPSPVNGTVIYVGDGYSGYGKVVDVLTKGNGNTARVKRFAHLDGWNVEVGDDVKAGDVVGRIGNTGTKGVHLHYEDRENYLFYKDGDTRTPIPYEEVAMMGPAALRRLTLKETGKGSTESRHLLADDDKRFGFEGTQNPNADAEVIKNLIRQRARSRKVVESLMNKLLLQPQPALKVSPKAEQSEKQKKTKAVAPVKKSLGRSHAAGVAN